MGLDYSNAKGVPMALLVLFIVITAIMVGVHIGFRGAVMV